MKNIKQIIPFFLFLFLFSSCKNHIENNGVTKTLDIKLEDVSNGINLSSLSKTSLVPLETSDSVLVGNINRIHNKPEAMYISDLSSVFKFSNDGKFINRITKTGEGPEEYLNISDFQVDDNENVWILCRNTKTLYLYSWDGTMTKKISFDLWVENIYLSGNKMILYTGNETSETDNCQLHILDIASGKIENNFKPVDKYQSKYLFVKGSNLFLKGEDDTTNYFYQLFNDTVYQISQSDMKAKYVINFDKRNIPRSFYEIDYKNIMDFFQKLNAAGSYAYGINSFLESEKSFWVTYFYKGECYCAVINKSKSGSSKIFNSFSVNGLPAGNNVNLSDVTIFSQDNGSLVIPLNSENTSEKESEESNPVLLIVKPL